MSKVKMKWPWLEQRLESFWVSNLDYHINPSNLDVMVETSNPKKSEINVCVHIQMVVHLLATQS